MARAESFPIWMSIAAQTIWKPDVSMVLNVRFCQFANVTCTVVVDHPFRIVSHHRGVRRVSREVGTFMGNTGRQSVVERSDRSTGCCPPIAGWGCRPLMLDAHAVPRADWSFKRKLCEERLRVPVALVANAVFPFDIHFQASISLLHAVGDVHGDRASGVPLAPGIALILR